MSKMSTEKYLDYVKDFIHTQKNDCIKYCMKNYHTKISENDKEKHCEQECRKYYDEILYTWIMSPPQS